MAARRVYDVAGGLGRLNAELSALGLEAVTFDSRAKRLPVRFAQRPFALDEPCECDLVAGLHPDGATRLIVAYAARHRIPFSIVPCCSDNGLPYRPWLRHLRALAEEAGFAVGEADLPIAGRAKVLTGRLPCP